MRVGITYDLKDDYRRLGFSEEDIAEFDELETIEAIEREISALGHEPCRIGNIWKLAEACSENKRWDLVFNIAEGMRGFGREAQVPALLDAYGIPYTFSDPLVLSLTLHKAHTKRIVRDFGVPTARFAVVETEADLGQSLPPFPLFAKPIAEGTGKGISGASVARTEEELKAVCLDLLGRFSQPVLVEEFLSGREFTVGILGTGTEARAIGVLEVCFNSASERAREVEECYSYVNKKEYQSRVSYHLLQDNLAAECAAVSLKAWRCLGCRDAGRVDLRCGSDGKPHFLEVNPLAGLHPVDSDLPILSRLAGTSYSELIAGIITSAIARIRPGAR